MFRSVNINYQFCLPPYMKLFLSELFQKQTYSLKHNLNRLKTRHFLDSANFITGKKKTYQPRKIQQPQN